MSDEQLQKQISDYQQLGKENPNVDVNLLMMNALANENKLASAPGKSYKWAYTVALGLPPLGLLFALKYYFGDDERDKQAAKICVLLTVVSVILIIVFSKMLFSTAGVNVQQLQQINPQQVQQELQ